MRTINGNLEVTDREAGFALLYRCDGIDEDASDANFESQLVAVSRLIDVLKKARTNDSQDVDEADSDTKKNRSDDPGVDENLQSNLIDKLHYNTYYSSAYSMATVGVLAPLIESLFKRAFASIRQRYYTSKGQLPACKRFEEENDFRWNCEYHIEKKRFYKGIIIGIKQLSEAVGLNDKFPPDYDKTIKALVEYRNYIFHCGFEWTLEDKKKFEDKINKNGWNKDWFPFSKTGSTPWMYNVSETFIKEIIELIDEIIDGLGAYVNARDKV